MPKMGGGGISARLIPTSLPTKLNYIEGEQLDTTGLIMSFKESSESDSININSYRTIPNNGSVLSRNDSFIKVEYDKDGSTYQYSIPIMVKYPVGIEVAQFPNNTYKPTEVLNTVGLTVYLIYNDGSKVIKTESIETNPYNGTQVGLNTQIKITYEDFETFYDLNINNIDSIAPSIVREINRSISSNIKSSVNSALRKHSLISNYICTFASGTDTQIKEMIKFADNGDIDISDYWRVGDERIVTKLLNDRDTTPNPVVIADINKVIANTRYNIVLIFKQSGVAPLSIFDIAGELNNLIDEKYTSRGYGSGYEYQYYISVNELNSSGTKYISLKGKKYDGDYDDTEYRNYAQYIRINKGFVLPFLKFANFSYRQFVNYYKSGNTIEFINATSGYYKDESVNGKIIIMSKEYMFDGGLQYFRTKSNIINIISSYNNYRVRVPNVYINKLKYTIGNYSDTYNKHRIYFDNDNDCYIKYIRKPSLELINANNSKTAFYKNSVLYSNSDDVVFFMVA